MYALQELAAQCCYRNRVYCEIHKKQRILKLRLIAQCLKRQVEYVYTLQSAWWFGNEKLEFFYLNIWEGNNIIHVGFI